MKKNRKDLSILSIATMATLTSIMALTMSTTVFAKTDAILTKDKTTGKYFQYDLAELNNDAVNKVMGIGSPLYDEYMGKVVQAFHDDKKGYIDQAVVNKAAVDAVMSGTTFNLDTYTESATASAVITPNGSIQTRVIANDGSVTNGTVIDVPVVEQPLTDNTDITSKFTDVNFKTEVYKLIGKTSPAPILYSDVKNITRLDVASKIISSLSGIENFIGLTYLKCDNNKLTNLDVTKNTALTTLICSGNYDPGLNATLDGNQLITLDVSKNTALTRLWCGGNKIITLDVSKNTALTFLNCLSNKLTNLDVSKNIALISLDCQNNQLTTLDVTKNTSLSWLVCDRNYLIALDVTKNIALTYLTCQINKIATLNVSNNTALTELYCTSNQLITLDVSKNTALTSLWCGNNKIVTLNVNNNIALTNLNCYSNQLSTLDISKNIVLKYLYCYNNQLTNLYSTKNTWATTNYNPQYTDSTHTTTTNNLVITVVKTVVKTFVSNGLLTVTDSTTTYDTIHTGVVASFLYKLYDQTLDTTNPLPVNSARMNYVVTNIGNNDISVDLGVFNAVNPNIIVSLTDTNLTSTVVIKPGQTRTIAGNVNSAVPTLKITAEAGAAVSVTATAQVFNRDIDGTGTLSTLYTRPSTATATYTGTPAKQALIAAGTFVGKLDDEVNTIANGIVKLNISANDYIQFSVTGVTAGRASAGLVTTTLKDFIVNDFNQATLLEDDLIIIDPVTGLTVGRTASQKLAAVLGKGAAVLVTFESGSTNSNYVITSIRVLYTNDIYVSDRTIIK